MLRVFQNDLLVPDNFVVTLELVPGRESAGRSVDTVMGIAKDTFADGRISAVSITDNPGGNPSLSPDALGYEIFRIGMDTIIHFTCRDTNRVGMESRALQLAMMGMKNILALTGDYTGKGFGGLGAPVFDLDSVNLQVLFSLLSKRLNDSGDPDGFFTGCAVSPFKQREGEIFAQYAKMLRKAAGGAKYIITQLGYDARKFEELILMKNVMGLTLPALGSVYVLTPGAARIMNQGRVPGAIVPDRLLERVNKEWKDKTKGKKAAVERAARLGAVLRGIGYNGIHIGGIHRDFSMAGLIMDRLETIKDRWREFLPEFDLPQPGGFYAFHSPAGESDEKPVPRFGRQPSPAPAMDKYLYHALQASHHLFFNFDSPLAPACRAICRHLNSNKVGRLLASIAEHPAKKILLGCHSCGDCAIQHVGFLCPESKCPKHTRNGACGGSLNGRCEVHPDKLCVWYRAHNRLVSDGKTSEMCDSCIPPRRWELDRTPSWINFHLRRDHHSASDEISQFCREKTCHL